MKAAVVEFNFYHDEILPSVVYALNQLGVTPDVYIPARAARKDAFARSPSLRYRTLLIDSPHLLARLRGTPARYGRYDVLIMNSIEPLGILESASRIDLPTVAIVHNAGLLQADGPYRRFFDSHAREPLFLGRHVARSFGPELAGSWLTPFYLTDDHSFVDTLADGRQRLCVQGNVQFARRDYGSLADAVVTLAAERSDFVVRIVGRSTWRDGLEFRATVADRGVAKHFVFNAGEISHEEYLTQVATSDFVLPLIDHRVAGLAPYYSVKITSSMSMAIGLDVIPIAEQTLAQLYGVEDAAVTFESGGLPEAIRVALDTEASVRTARRDRLARIRADALASSVENIASALERVGAAHA
jgi:hypothetical protein